MKKNKLYILISIIVLICFFGTAAICNQCAADAVEEAESTEEEVEAVVEAVEEEGETPESEEEETEEEEPAKEESTREEKEEEPAQEVQTEAPTISLEVYEGPIYSSADNVCYYRIKANVTGKPNPIIEFSKDDSDGAWGSKKVQINLNDPSDNYTLTATVTNSEGTDTDSINLSWGCPILNNPPEISEIVLLSMGTHPNINYSYEVKVNASDPDGDNLTYKWDVTGGTVDNPNSNQMTWNTPGLTGDYAISVKVEDGNDGIAEDSIQVGVYRLVELHPLVGEGGEIIRNEIAHPGNFPYIGDTDTNQPVKGFISFDITGLSGAEVVYVHLALGNEIPAGDNPSELIEAVWLEVVDWGNGQIEYNDYNLNGILVMESENPNFSCVDGRLIDELRKAITDGKERLQLRIRHKGFSSDNDNMADGWSYQNIKLWVTYR